MGTPAGALQSPKLQRKIVSMARRTIGDGAVRSILDVAHEAFVEAAANNCRKSGLKVEMNYVGLMAHSARVAHKTHKTLRKRIAQALVEIQDKLTKKAAIREEITAVALEVLR